MGQTKIEWTSYQRPDGTIVPGYTVNPVIGCAKKSPGCKNCYAENDTVARVARSQHVELWGVDASRQVTKSWPAQVRAWNHSAYMLEETRLVFCASQSDWLEDRPEWEEPRANLLKAILDTPNLTWLLLSKEPWNFGRLLNLASDQMFLRGEVEYAETITRWVMGEPYFANVRLGVSVENQEWADKRRDAFVKLPGSKFVSYEPALGPVDWAGWEFVDQIISGGESGKDARPSHPNWHRATRDWCAANGKAYFFKQYGEWKPISQMTDVENNALYRSNKIAEDPYDQGKYDEIYGRTCVVANTAVRTDGYVGDKAFWSDGGHSGMQVFRVGKNSAGNLLDGRQHLEIPGINFPKQEVA